MEEVINIYNASEPIMDRDSYKQARQNSRRMNSVQDEDIKYNNMSGPNMMAIDRAINRSRNKYGPKKMRD
jgi:hypothetical protein|tara:strand:+ start:2803 stop:3012 length:210 start_codon:yes stop_codon:yes gene_type:complete